MRAAAALLTRLEKVDHLMHCLRHCPRGRRNPRTPHRATAQGVCRQAPGVWLASGDCGRCAPIYGSSLPTTMWSSFSTPPHRPLRSMSATRQRVVRLGSGESGLAAGGSRIRTISPRVMYAFGIGSGRFTRASGKVGVNENDGTRRSSRDRWFESGFLQRRVSDEPSCRRARRRC
jgi:hypothetical protein